MIAKPESERDTNKKAKKDTQASLKKRRLFAVFSIVDKFPSLPSTQRFKRMFKRSCLYTRKSRKAMHVRLQGLEGRVQDCRCPKWELI